MTYKTQDVCCTEIKLDIDGGGIISAASFVNGCKGNLTGIGKLITGMKAEDAMEKLNGITCGNRDTSCPDQLAKALGLWLKNN
jgi:uncharacterized protein (TIGR03905 family)